MNGINSCTLLGVVASEPQTRQAGSSQVAEFRLAVTELFPGRNGEPDKHFTEFLTITAWGNLARIAGALRKGMPCAVTGKVKTRSWDDRETGKKTYKTEINASTLAPISFADETDAAPVAPPIAQSYERTPRPAPVWPTAPAPAPVAPPPSEWPPVYRGATPQSLGDTAPEEDLPF